jgi:hypothetical protein
MSEVVIVCILQAYVSTLTDKLSRPSGIRWLLPCKINDGSAVMDVNLSDKVIMSPLFQEETYCLILSINTTVSMSVTKSYVHSSEILYGS